MSHSFPATLQEVPAEHRIHETFGFTPLSLAAGSVLGLLGSLVGLVVHGFQDVSSLYLPLGCLAGIVLFGGWELWRRRRRTTLVVMGHQMGVYRSGQLSEVAHRSSLVIYQLSVINTIRELFASGFLGAGCLLTGMAMLGGDLGIGLCLLGVGVGLSGAFVSSIYARIACRQFYVPRGGGSELVVLRRDAVAPLGV